MERTASRRSFPRPSFTTNTSTVSKYNIAKSIHLKNQVNSNSKEELNSGHKAITKYHYDSRLHIADMASSPSIPDTNTTTEPEAEATLASDESLQTDMPMTMAASVVLDHLPRDAHTALSKAGLLDKEKSKTALTHHPNTCYSFYPAAYFLLSRVHILNLLASIAPLPPRTLNTTSPQRPEIQNVFIPPL